MIEIIGAVAKMAVSAAAGIGTGRITKAALEMIPVEATGEAAKAIIKCGKMGITLAAEATVTCIVSDKIDEAEEKVKTLMQKMKDHKDSKKLRKTIKTAEVTEEIA